MIWKPDTCECELEYNGQNSPANFVRAIKLCPFHKEIEHPIVLGENQTKNKAMSELGKIPALTSKILDENGQMVDVLDRTKVRWSYDANRELQIELPTLNAVDKATALNLVKVLSTKIRIK